MSPFAARPSDPFDRAFPDRLMAKTSFFALAVSHQDRSWHTAGVLREPASPAPRAAVVFVHGSGGVDSRGECYANALNQVGIVTLEIDLWAARGIHSPRERPRHPAETLPDAFAALDFLGSRSGIEPSRIGIMGTSWGGIVSMLSATQRARYVCEGRAEVCRACAALSRLPALQPRAGIRIRPPDGFARLHSSGRG